jgi:hypothetical protein
MRGRDASRLTSLSLSRKNPFNSSLKAAKSLSAPLIVSLMVWDDVIQRLKPIARQRGIRLAMSVNNPIRVLNFIFIVCGCGCF